MSDHNRPETAWRAYEKLAFASPLSTQTIVVDAAWRFAGNLAFPRLCHRLRWTSRLGPRGTAVYVGAQMAVGMAARGFGAHLARRYAVAIGELRDELGRDPTDAEIAERLGWDPPQCPR